MGKDGPANCEPDAAVRSCRMAMLDERAVNFE